MKYHQNATAETIARTRDQWSGIIPFLRIIHRITDFDSIREALLLSFQVMNRPELDGQHNENIRRNDPWVLIADKWNDTNYNLGSKTYPELHEEFTNEIDIGHAKVAGMGELTPEKAKQKYMKMKSQMVIVRSKWRASGNGEGSIQKSRETSVDADSIEDQMDDAELVLMDANDKKNFLNGYSPSILYF